MPINLQNFDIFGQKFNFYMNGRTATKTLPGFIFTILAILIILGSFVLFYIVMLDRTLPQTEITKIVKSESSSIKLMEEVFVFITLINYRTVIPLNYVALFTKITVSYTFEEVRNDPFATLGENIITTLKQDIKLVPCYKTQSYQRFKQHYSDSEQLLITNAGLCLEDPPANSSYLIKSTRGQVYSNLKMTLNFYPCQLPMGCVPFAGKKDLLYFIAVVENGYNGMDFEKPVVQVRNMQNRLQAYEGVTKDMDIIFGKFTSVTDSGKIFESLTYEDGFYVYYDANYDFRPSAGTPTSPLLTVNLVASMTDTIYKRSYGKFVNFISNLGGIVQITVSLFAAIYLIYNKYVRKRDLIIYGIMDIMPPGETSDDEFSRNQNMSGSQKPPLTPLSSTIKRRDTKKKNTKLAIKDAKSTFNGFWRYLLFSSNKRPTGNGVNSLEDFRKYEYWNSCEKMLLYTTEVNNMLLIMNELSILQAVFLTDYHRKVSPRIGAYFLHRERREHAIKDSINSQDAYEYIKEYIIEYKNQQKSEELSVLGEIRLVISEALISDYEKYREREKTNFQFMSGIHELMNSQFFKDFNSATKKQKTGKKAAHPILLSPIPHNNPTSTMETPMTTLTAKALNQPIVSDRFLKAKVIKGGPLELKAMKKAPRLSRASIRPSKLLIAIPVPSTEHPLMSIADDKNNPDSNKHINLAGSPNKLATNAAVSVSELSGNPNLDQ